MLKVKEIIKTYSIHLEISLVSGSSGLENIIGIPEIQRPGLSLAGYTKHYIGKRIIVLGKEEMEFLEDLSVEVRYQRLRVLFSFYIPLVIIARGYVPLPEIVDLCDANKVPLLSSSLPTMDFIGKLTLILSDAFRPSKNIHGTLMDIFGMGVLITGNSSVGKTEAALELIKRGHRLVADDIVNIYQKGTGNLEGKGVDLSCHHMEIKGIGLINVVYLHGAACIKESIDIDMIVHLERGKDQYLDRMGLKENFKEMMGVEVPVNLLKIEKGRDVVLLLETCVLNRQSKKVGYNSVKEFNEKLLTAVAMKTP